MVSQNKLHLLHFKLEISNKNFTLNNELIYPCTQFLNPWFVHVQLCYVLETLEDC